jgi:preprotein translocase subunit SecF
MALIQEISLLLAAGMARVTLIPTLLVVLEDQVVEPQVVLIHPKVGLQYKVKETVAVMLFLILVAVMVALGVGVLERPA